MNLFFLF